MANSWGESGTTWSQGDWGEQNNFTLTLTGLSMTGSVGEPAAYSEQGWGRAEWGDEPWGDSYDPVIAVTGYSITSSLGTPYAAAEEGWGRDEWGYGNWGENTTTVVLTDSFEITAGLGPSGWGIAPWEEQVSWGGDLSLTTTQLSIAALTGIEATLSLGTPTLAFDMIFDITGPAAMSAGIGTLSINNGADHSQGLASLLITGSLGTLGHEMAYDLTGIEATMSLGTPTVSDAQLVDVTGIEATGSLGSLTIADMAIGLSGLSITGSVGSLTVTDMQVGISGIEMSGTLGSAGMSPLHYKDVDITGNTSYTYVKHAGEI
jgi:hypothetical protein